MPRWEHGSEERLKQAAMELFEQQGYEETSAVQIAKRAGVTSRTFFRYFPDKEEVLFADADALHESLVEQLLQRTDITEPLQAVTRTLSGHAWEKLGSRKSQLRRDALIAANPELLERELIKQQRMADELGGALRQRGVDPEIAELAANAGTQVFRTAYRQWLHGRGDTDLTTITESVLALLASIVGPSRRRAAAKRLP